MASSASEQGPSAPSSESRIQNNWIPQSISGYLPWGRSRSSGNHPPVIGGAVPWIGCAVSFGKEPLTFIRDMHIKHGDIFTIHAAGKYMTFLMNPDDHASFFQGEPDVNFQLAVQPFTNRAAGVEVASFHEFHTRLHDAVKGKLAKVDNYILDLSKRFESQYDSRFSGPDQNVGVAENLHQLVRKMIFYSQTAYLFGDEFMNPTDADEIFKEFFIYDEQFEYGAELPEVFLPRWAKAKHYLLGKFRGIVDVLLAPPATPDADHSRLSSLIAHTVDRNNIANFSLLMLWATNANGVPISFWTLAYILTNDRVLSRVREEITAVLPDSSTLIDVKHIDKLVYLRWCVLEAIRLRSPGMITRKATKDIPVRDFIIPEGNLMMVSPYWTHRVERLYPDADAYRPERWDGKDHVHYMNDFRTGFIAFGGGRYQCPGRWFAIKEILLFLSITLRKLDIRPADPIPPANMQHLVGTQEPTKPFTCVIRPNRA